ncbi:MAG TPA: hypothetical protein VHO25_17680 [Polyangiaceae bacterium]|nr:hypothetical protein [Polyangiaceae bacterium]
MKTTLGRESFLALAAVAWADGRMTKEESAGLLRAAKASGLNEADCATIADSMGAPIKLADLSFGQASAWERALTYALGCWLSQMDGSLNAAERESLVALGKSLDLPELKLKSAASAAFDIACLPGGHKPDRYDFAALEERLKTKLPSLAQG